MFPRSSRGSAAAAGLHGSASGTSFAAPQVAGAAALVWAANPRLSARQVADVLKATASGHGSWTPGLGFGVIDVAAAVDLATNDRDAIGPDCTFSAARLSWPRAAEYVSASGRGEEGGSRTSGSVAVPTPVKLGLAALVALVVYRRARVFGRAAKDQPAGATAVILGAFALANPSDDPVSPELALVDSTLRERIAMDEQAQASEAVQAPPEVGPAVETDVSTGQAIERRRSRRFVGGVVAVLVLAAAVVAAIALVEMSRRDAAPVPAPTVATHSSTTAPASGPSARNFAWAPVQGASEYDVEIRRNGKVLYAATTSVPHVKVPAQWERGRRKLTLSPGAYQWYVWPILGASGRRGAALVATTFVIH